MAERKGQKRGGGIRWTELGIWVINTFQVLHLIAAEASEQK